MKKQQKEMSYLDSVHRAGRIWNVSVHDAGDVPLPDSGGG